MVTVGLAITNVLVGLGSIGAGIGFSVTQKQKIDELNTKSQTLKDDVTAAANLYELSYFPVAENLVRVKKALDKLPSDLQSKLQSEIGTNLDSITGSVAAMVALVNLLAETPSSHGSDTAPSGYGTDSKPDKPGGSTQGYRGDVMLAMGDILAMVLVARSRSRVPSEPTSDESDAFDNSIELNELIESAHQAEVSSDEVSSIPAGTTKLDNVVKGLDILSAVFGVAGLAATIGLGVWTVDKLDTAISDVETKQKQVTAFDTAMKKVLDAVAEAGGLSTPTDSYDDVTNMATTWKTISENCDSYAKSFYYAIQGYYTNKSLAEVTELVNSESDAGTSFPDDAYSLTETLAGEIQTEFNQNKTDQEMVVYFATENPVIGERCVFNEFFITSLRWTGSTN